MFDALRASVDIALSCCLRSGRGRFQRPALPVADFVVLKASGGDAACATAACPMSPGVQEQPQDTQ